MLSGGCQRSRSFCRIRMNCRWATTITKYVLAPLHALPAEVLKNSFFGRRLLERPVTIPRVWNHAGQIERIRPCDDVPPNRVTPGNIAFSCIRSGSAYGLDRIAQ